MHVFVHCPTVPLSSKRRSTAMRDFIIERFRPEHSLHGKHSPSVPSAAKRDFMYRK